MTGFLYWLPDGGVTVTRDDIKRLKLTYAIDVPVTPHTATKGPDGRRGCTFVVGDNRDGRCGYYPERQQQWRQLPDSEVWCGMYQQYRPTPTDLQRNAVLPGMLVRDDSDNEWLVPTARRWQEVDSELFYDCNLPRRLSYADEGVWLAGDVKPRYQRLWELVKAYDAAVQAALLSHADDYTGPVQFTFNEIDEFAIAALQVNYRVGPVELDLLGCYDIELRQQIIDAVLDTATFTQWVQKKTHEPASGGSSSHSGQEQLSTDKEPTTGQLTLT